VFDRQSVFNRPAAFLQFAITVIPRLSPCSSVCVCAGKGKNRTIFLVLSCVRFLVFRGQFRWKSNKQEPS